MERRGQTDEEVYDNRLDELVDKGMSYVEARGILGPPPYEMMRTPYDHIEVNLGGIAVSTFFDRRIISDEEAIRLIDEPQSSLPFVPKSDSQMAIDRIGREQVRRAMAA